MPTKSILVIDDQQKNRQIIMSLLSGSDTTYEFLQAPDALVGLALLNKITPDLILVDWEMPNMSGIEFIQEVKKKPAHIDTPIIMVTGVMTSPENLKISFDAGAVDFIRKPINPFELEARVKSVLLIAQLHQNELASKKRELAQMATSLLQKTEILQKISEQVQQMQSEFKMTSTLKESLGRLSDFVESEADGNVWKHLQFFLDSVEKGFMQRLTERYPDLTTAELKLTVLLRLNLSSKEIATILCQSPDSVNVSRSRLKKKLNIDGEQNLQASILAI